MKDSGGTVGRAGRQRRSRVGVEKGCGLGRLVDIKWGCPGGRGLRGLVLRRVRWAVGRGERATEG